MCMKMLDRSVMFPVKVLLGVVPFMYLGSCSKEDDQLSGVDRRPEKASYSEVFYSSLSYQWGGEDSYSTASSGSRHRVRIYSTHAEITPVDENGNLRDETSRVIPLNRLRYIEGQQ